jgi:hypothetical protein
MLRRFLVTLSLATLALAGAARADGSGGSITASQGSPGAVSPDGTVRYVALAAGGGRTMVEAIRTRDGWTMGFGSVAGAYGTPWAGPKMGGLSPDGRTLVLAQATAYTGLRRVSRFLVFDTRQLWRARRIALRGDFAFDALSPHGRTLFLIQHMSARNLSRYVVRAYDLRRSTLLPQRIADRTQRGWVMSGYPVARATSAGGRWVYTLYQNPGGYPFVHALDTVGRRAHCVGVPWRGKDQSGLWKLALSVGGGGKQLALRWRSGRRYLTIDTRSFRISHPQSHRASGTGAGLWPLAGAAAAALALASGGLFAARRRWRLPKASAARKPAPIP